MGHERTQLRLAFICLCLFLACLACLGCLACSGETNPFSFLVSDKDRQAFDAQLALGQTFYDIGDFSKALTHAEKAYAGNPQSESAAVLLGYVYLALAGISPFSLIERMGQKSEKGQEQTSGEPGSEEKGEDKQGADKALGDFGVALGLEAADLLLLGRLNTDVAFLPIIEPDCAGQARLSLSKLTYANRAIQVICPFVDAKLRLSEEERHGCAANEQRHAKRGEGHLLWALAHMLEAATFYGVITYNTTGQAKTNLEQRMDEITQLNIQSPDDIPVLLEKMQSFALTLDQVLQVAGSCSEAYPQSQLMALVNDLIAVSYAFGNMPGIPEFLTASIDEALANLTSLRDKGAGVAEKAAQASAVKGDLTKKMATALKQALSKLPIEQYSAEQVEELCQGFYRISGDQSDRVPAPDFCP